MWIALIAAEILFKYSKLRYNGFATDEKDTSHFRMTEVLKRLKRKAGRT